MPADILIQCKHCGDNCTSQPIELDGNVFCCNGCSVVYQLLVEHDLNGYYQFESHPGNPIKASESDAFNYLDDTLVIEKLLSFNEDGIAKVKLRLPQIHCSACLYLLENISKLNDAIFYSKVDFVSKEATFRFRTKDCSLRQLVELLTQIGYEPLLRFDQLDNKKERVTINHDLIYKIGLAGVFIWQYNVIEFSRIFGIAKLELLSLLWIH